MAHEIKPKEIVVYQDSNGDEPYTLWINNLRDKDGQRRIRARVRRLATGLFGDCQSVGSGLMELRLFFGPGYRVYFGESNNNIVVLLCGGDKSTQTHDIKTAKHYWKEYKSNDR